MFQKIKESEERYRTVLEVSPDPIVVCDMFGRVIFSNPAFTQVFGWAKEEIFENKIDFGSKGNGFETQKMIDKALSEQSFSGVECLISTKTGDILEINMSGAVYHDRDGNPAGSIMTLRDVTEQKQIEAQLRQAQKMESLGTLAGGIAHDFNNILFPIMGYTEMLLEDVSNDKHLRQGLDEILIGAKRARDLVKQILTFSRQKKHELKPLKVQLVVGEALKLVQSSLPATIKIGRDVNKDCGLVLADSTQIHQIVMNLITNAHHAMQETGGNLDVTLKEVELEAGDLGDRTMNSGLYVCLTVADTGIGMDQSVIDRIFDPYFTTKKEGKGTGLGLAVVHGIVKSHGGYINVCSEPGQGTEFHVYLPVIQTQARNNAMKTSLPVEKGNKNVLLVDDREEIVSLIMKMLGKLGYHVTPRTSSIEALETFRANPHNFDFVITDLTMPDMTGDKLAGELLKIRSDIPVILCTGFNEGMTGEKAESLGIKGFLMKPVVLDDLSSMIRKVLDNHPGLGSTKK
ncbi:MAG: ATP-binding protein [Thermodesulfobacteriota bacterium]|nr:ATP-binding protein [Thermodesulfobacteriota bacterium]